MNWKRFALLLVLQALISMSSAGISENQQFLGAVRDGEIARVRELLAQGMKPDTRNARNDETALMIASNTGNLEMMELLISAGARVDEKTRPGMSVLGFAVQNHRPESVKFLLQHGARIKQLRRSTPAKFHGIPIPQHNEVADALFLGVLYDTELLEMLLAAGADANSADPGSGSTVLTRAAFHGRTEAVRRLLEAGADVNLADKQGTTAFDIALRVNDIRQRDEYPVIRMLLLEHGAKPIGATASRAYAVAIEQADIPFLEALVAQHVDVDQPAGSGEYPLTLALKKNNIEMARLLIEHGADPDIRSRKDGRTAIFHALQNPQLFRLLVQHHASFDVRDDRGYSVLAAAVSQADADTITEIINSGRVGDVIRENGGQMLMTAVNRKLPGIAALLIPHGADVEYLGTGYFEGKTPLQLAFDRDKKDAALVLIRSGADIHRIRKGYAPFLMRTKDIDLIKALLDAGADVNETYNGRTALHAALDFPGEAANAGIVKLLLEKGARMDAEDPARNLFLMHRLCIQGDMTLIRKLYAAGAPVNATPGESWTPLMGAARNGSVELIEFLLARGARVNDTYEHVVVNYGDNPSNLTHPAETSMRESPLMLAALNGNSKALALLLSRGADANVTLHSGMNALMLVVDDGAHAEEIIRERRRREMERYTRERNAASSVAALQAFSEETRVREKLTSPELASQTDGLPKDVTVVETVKAAGLPKGVITVESIDMSVKGTEYRRYQLQQEQGKIRLQKRRQANRFDMMKLLIGAGIAVNRQDEVFGQTPLMQAIRFGDSRAVKMLLDAGARVDLRDKAGKTPADYARASGDGAILKMIRSATASTH